MTFPILKYSELMDEAARAAEKKDSTLTVVSLCNTITLLLMYISKLEEEATKNA